MRKFSSTQIKPHTNELLYRYSRQTHIQHTLNRSLKLINNLLLIDIIDQCGKI